MCGLTGLWGVAGADPAARVAPMTAALGHRGPDDAGLWSCAEAGLALGHRRLAVIDLRPEAAQPMTAEDGSALVFNGEVYNFQELRPELERRGCRFRSASDTEVVLHALRQWGPEGALPRFRGMFALVWWDGRRRELVLARDRLGIKPLYWSQAGGELRFGSELKALLADPRFRPGLDRAAAAAFLRWKYVPGPASILRGVGKLPPGTFLRLSGPGAVAVPQPFWTFAEVAAAAAADPWPGDEAAQAQRFLAVLDRAVALHLVADVPVGAFLSGGVDSSLVAARMKELSAAPTQTFTVGFREAGYDESADARRVAEALGTEHHEITLTADDALALIPELPRWWDEPFGDSSQLATQLICRFARRRVTVVLSGDGGDELFGGYGRYGGTLARWRRLRRIPGRRLAGCLLGDSAVGTLLRCRGFAELYRHSLGSWKAPADLVRGSRAGLLASAEKGAAEAVGDSAALDAAGSDPDPVAARAWMTALDTLSYLPDDILCKVDRASMSCALEARVPFLDHEVVASAWRIPPALRFGCGDKPLLRRLLAAQLPAAAVKPGKQGFSVPIGPWLRGPLRAWAEELLDPGLLRAQGLLRPEPVRAAWCRLLRGRDAEHARLWNVLMLQAWLREWGIEDLGAGEPAP